MIKMGCDLRKNGEIIMQVKIITAENARTLETLVNSHFSENEYNEVVDIKYNTTVLPSVIGMGGCCEYSAMIIIK